MYPENKPSISLTAMFARIMTNLPIPNIHPASNFQVPQVEPLLDPEEYWGEDWDK